MPIRTLVYPIDPLLSTWNGSETRRSPKWSSDIGTNLGRVDKPKGNHCTITCNIISELVEIYPCWLSSNAFPVSGMELVAAWNDDTLNLTTLPIPDNASRQSRRSERLRAGNYGAQKSNLAGHAVPLCPQNISGPVFDVTFSYIKDGIHPGHTIHHVGLA